MRSEEADRRRRLPRGVMVGLLLAIAGSAAGPSLVLAAFEMPPERACALLAEHRLDGGSYRQQGDDRGFCASPRRRLPFGSPRNEIRFRAEGDATLVRRLELIVNVTGTSGSQPTLTRMVEAAADLVRGALDADLPESIQQGILAATNARAEVDEATIDLRRRSAGTAGFEMILTVE